MIAGHGGVLDLARHDSSTPGGKSADSEVAGLGASTGQDHICNRGPDGSRNVFAGPLEQLP